MPLTANAIDSLISRCEAALKKCSLPSLFGCLAVAGMLVIGGAGMAAADDYKWYYSTAENNWEEGTSDDAEKYAGKYQFGEDVWGGKVKIDTGGNDKIFYGGYAADSGSAGSDAGNTVTMTGGSAKAVYGGWADNAANGNKVVISKGTVGNGDVLSGVYGGHTQENGAGDNTVIIKEDSTVNGNVYGGWADNTSSNGAAAVSGDREGKHGNTVTISDSTVNGNVYGGWGKGKTIGSTKIGAAYNTVTISNSKVIGSVYGGYYSDPKNGADFYTNNTLRVENKVTVGENVGNFQYFSFVIPESVNAGDTLLSATRTVAFGGNAEDRTVEISKLESLNILGDARIVGDEFTLLKANSTEGKLQIGETAIDNDAAKALTQETEDHSYRYSLFFNKDNTELHARILEVLVNGKDFGRNLDGELGHMFDDAFAGGEVRPSFANDYTKPAGVRFLARAISREYGNGSGEAAKEVESVSQMTAVAAVPQMTMGASLAGADATGQRTTIAQPTGSLQSVAFDNASGLNSGDDITGLSAGSGYGRNGLAMWIMPLWQSNSSFGLKSGDFEMDSHASIGGLAIGADYTWDEMYRLGLTFNIGGGYAEGSGDLSKTTNNMNFWGMGAYAGWSHENFGLTADVNYTSTNSSVKQEVHPGFGMQDMESDIMASAVSAGLRAEYRFSTDALDIIPHLGVRYTHLTTYGYDVESAGQTVLEADASHQNIWTFPAGVQFAKSFELNSNWYIRPSLDLTVTPAAGDINVKREVRFSGVTASASPETQTMDWFTCGGQAGLEFGTDNVKLGVNYNLQAGAHTTSHGVFGTFRYEF